MQLIVKVDLSRAADPVAHVASVLRTIAPTATAREVFPGLRTGASAGLVTVRCPDVPATLARECIAALEVDAAVAYVNGPRPRRPL